MKHRVNCPSEECFQDAHVGGRVERSRVPPVHQQRLQWRTLPSRPSTVRVSRCHVCGGQGCHACECDMRAALRASVMCTYCFARVRCVLSFAVHVLVSMSDSRVGVDVIHTAHTARPRHRAQKCQTLPRGTRCVAPAVPPRCACAQGVACDTCAR